MNHFVRIASEEMGYRWYTLRQQIGKSQRADHKKILVNGSPKTGTTWMIRMLTSLPGYRAIGNFDGEIARYAGVQPGDVVHGHDPLTPELATLLRDNGIKVVLTLRDPRDQVVSRMYHFRRAASGRLHETFINMSNQDAIMACIEGGPGIRSSLDLVELTRSWFNQPVDVACVKYEDLLSDPVHELSQILDFLGLQVHPNLVRLIVQRNRFERLAIGKKFWKAWRVAGQEDPNSHFRKGIRGDWMNYFTPEHKQRFKEVAGSALIELGYESDFSW